MLSRLGLLAALTCSLSAAASAGCASDPAPTAARPNWQADIKPIVDAHCNDCHTKGGIAPFELGSREQVVAMKASILSDLHGKRMPPFAADPKVRQYRFDDSLTPAQVALFEKWFANGATAGTLAQAGPAIVLERPTLSKVDFKFKMPNVYKPAKAPDDYRCLVVDWPYTTDKYVTGFGVTPGNAKIAHHAIIFSIPPSDADQIDKFDKDDPGEGYECYGAPFPAKANIQMAFVGEWAPGTQGVDYPKGTGIKVTPGTRLVLQMHYNTAADPGGSDQTEISMALADSVEREAWFLPWFNMAWFFDSTTMKVTAGDAKAEQEFEAVPHGSQVATLTLSGADLSAGFLVHAVLPHMHTRGRTIDLTALPAVGAPDILIRILNWDFNWQRLYFLAQPAKVHQGDKVRVRCQWDNSAANQPIVDGKKLPPKELHWGEGTYDEMCLAFMYITIK
ncbi:MAG: monooxygenase [Myxococcales bacterium]|nr:monooxygenase [Myxococcales bacterium]